MFKHFNHFKHNNTNLIKDTVRKIEEIHTRSSMTILGLCLVSGSSDCTLLY